MLKFLFMKFLHKQLQHGCLCLDMLLPDKMSTSYSVLTVKHETITMLEKLSQYWYRKVTLYHKLHIVTVIGVAFPVEIQRGYSFSLSGVHKLVIL